MTRVGVVRALAVVLLLMSGPATGSTGLPPLDSASLQGDWVGFDARTGHVLRLRIKERVVTFVVTAGPKQSEFTFRAKDFVVENGKFSATPSEQPDDPKIRIDGQGRANPCMGFMTVKISGRVGRYVELCREEVELVKECSGFSVADLLARNDKRAKVLLDDAQNFPRRGNARDSTKGNR